MKLSMRVITAFRANDMLVIAVVPAETDLDTISNPRVHAEICLPYSDQSASQYHVGKLVAISLD